MRSHSHLQPYLDDDFLSAVALAEADDDDEPDDEDEEVEEDEEDDDDEEVWQVRLTWWP